MTGWSSLLISTAMGTAILRHMTPLKPALPRLPCGCRALATVAMAAVLLVAEASAQTRTYKTFGPWRVLLHDGGGSQICFAIAQPRSSEPPAAAESAYLYVSAWPKEGVRAEVSVKTTAPIKPGAPASIAIDQAVFKLFSRGDRAYVIDATDELKLVEAMKRSSSVVVLAQSERGVISKDTYSLAGITQALQAVSGGCR